MSEGEKKSPWAKRLEEQTDLTEGDKETLAWLDEISKQIKPCLAPVKWNELDEKAQHKVREIFCSIKHLFSICEFSDDLFCTVLSEIFGELVGKRAKSAGDATLTIALFSERMVSAAQTEMNDRRVKEILSKLLRNAGAPEGRPN